MRALVLGAALLLLPWVAVGVPAWALWVRPLQGQLDEAARSQADDAARLAELEELSSHLAERKAEHPAVIARLERARSRAALAKQLQSGGVKGLAVRGEADGLASLGAFRQALTAAFPKTTLTRAGGDGPVAFELSVPLD